MDTTQNNGDARIDRPTLLQVHAILQALLDKARAGKIDGRYGICAALEDELEAASIDPEPIFEDLIQVWIRSWPQCSWSADWPVPSPELSRSSHAYFVKASTEGKMWEGEYGASRLSLLEHLVRRSYLAAHLN